MRMFQSIKILMLFITMLVGLSACSLFSPVTIEPTCLYQIKLTPSCVAHKAKRPIVILVTVPESVPAYNTSLMAYSCKPFQIGYFARNRWVATPSLMLQELLVETLIDTHHYHAVISQPYASRYDYVLASHVLGVLQDYSHCPPVAIFNIRVSMTKANENTILATRDFLVVHPFHRIRPYAGVIAINDAVAEGLSEIAIFALQHS